MVTHLIAQGVYGDGKLARVVRQDRRYHIVLQGLVMDLTPYMGRDGVAEVVRHVRGGRS